MKMFSAAAQAAIAEGTAVSAGAVGIECLPTPVRVWGGYGDLTLAGDVYRGIGDRGLVQASGGSLGSAEQNITLTLSGIDPEMLELFDATSLRRAPVVIWRVLYDSSCTQLLDAKVYARGRLDRLPVKDVPGGTATIEAVVEGAARGLGRRGGRMRTDADQRLVEAQDEGFKAVAFVGERTLYWGGKPPARGGQALNGGYVGGGGIGLSGIGYQIV